MIDHIAEFGRSFRNGSLCWSMTPWLICLIQSLEIEPGYQPLRWMSSVLLSDNCELYERMRKRDSVETNVLPLDHATVPEGIDWTQREYE
jgi:hypothetical protein